jgi:FtsZ-binding cell division protein ZapB
MSLPTTVPFELFEALQDQLQQALQMIAAITLTDEEVILCKNPRRSNTENALDEDEEEDEEEEDGNHLLGWAETMKADLLNPGEYGRDALIDILTRHQFLTNTHAGFIYGAFEGPQITYGLANQANLLIGMLNQHEAGVGEDLDSEDLRTLLESKLREAGASDDRIEYLFRIMAVKFPMAVMNRMRMELNIKSNAAVP